MMVNKERLLAEFIRLVSFDAESYREREIADYLKKQLQAVGLQVEEDEAGEKIRQKLSGDERAKLRDVPTTGNLYGFLPAFDPEGIYPEGILLSAHMDTVKPGISKQAVVHEDGRITSEGKTVLGADDAAGLAEILETLRVLQERKLPHPQIEVLFTVAEEPYAQGSRVLEDSKIQAKLAYVLDLSGPVGRAAIAAPSILSFYVEVKGKSAHAGFCPEAGVHALQIAAKAIARIPNGHVDAKTTVNVGTIQGGTARNIVPESCQITGEIRSMDHGKALEQAGLIQNIFREEAAREDGTVRVEITEEFRGYRMEEEELVTARFSRACKELGLSGELEETFGGSDNNHFTAGGMRGIVVANAMNEVHTTQEYTKVEELMKAAELTLKLVTVNMEQPVTVAIN